MDRITRVSQALGPTTTRRETNAANHREQKSIIPRRGPGMPPAVADQSLRSWLWRATFARHVWLAGRSGERSERFAKVGAGNGIRTRDFDLGKVALYH